MSELPLVTVEIIAGVQNPAKEGRALGRDAEGRWYCLEEIATAPGVWRRLTIGVDAALAEKTALAILAGDPRATTWGPAALVLATAYAAAVLLTDPPEPKNPAGTSPAPPIGAGSSSPETPAVPAAGIAATAVASPTADARPAPSHQPTSGLGEKAPAGSTSVAMGPSMATAMPAAGASPQPAAGPLDRAGGRDLFGATA